MKTEISNWSARMGALCAILTLTVLFSVGCGKTESGESAADNTSTEEQTDNAQVAEQAEGDQADVAEVVSEDEATTEQPAPKMTTYEAPAGMNLVVELSDDIETGQIQTGDEFFAILVDPVVISGETIFAAGSHVVGLVEHAVGSGRLKTDAELQITIVEVDGEQVVASSIEDKAASHADRNKKLIGGGAIVGGILGALKGKDVKGAIIGAAAGAAAGTGAAALTGKQNLKYEAGTLMQFTLIESVKVTR